jgi:hypothetical protein
MQPKELNAHARCKYEPTRVQIQLECRLFGKTFRSVAAAASYYELSLSTAYEWHHEHKHRETFPKTKRWDKWRAEHEVADTDSNNAG